jgi:hypothetical protein
MQYTSDINKKSWEIRKAAANKFDCKVSEIMWGICLDLAKRQLNIEDALEEIAQISKIADIWGKIEKRSRKIKQKIKNEMAEINTITFPIEHIPQITMSQSTKINIAKAYYANDIANKDMINGITFIGNVYCRVEHDINWDTQYKRKDESTIQRLRDLKDENKKTKLWNDCMSLIINRINSWQRPIIGMEFDDLMSYAGEVFTNCTNKFDSSKSENNNYLMAFRNLLYTALDNRFNVESKRKNIKNTFNDFDFYQIDNFAYNEGGQDNAVMLKLSIDNMGSDAQFICNSCLSVPIKLMNQSYRSKWDAYKLTKLSVVQWLTTDEGWGIARCNRAIKEIKDVLK